MTLPSSAVLVALALKELPMMADDLAHAILISRAQLDAWTIAADTMPFPVRAALAGALMERAKTPEQRELAALLVKHVAIDATLESARFVRDELRGLAPAEREARWNEYLAAPMHRHPALPPVTVAQMAERVGLTVEAMLRADDETAQ